MDKIELRCCKCGAIKDSSEFSIRRGTKRGFAYSCKSCYNKDFRNRITSRGQTYSDIYKRSRDTYPERYILNVVRGSAKQRGIFFDLDISDISIPKICPVLKCPIIIGGGVQNMYSPSIDRLDNSKGYTKDNIQIISRLANIMKNCSTDDQLIQFCIYHLERLKSHKQLTWSEMK